MSLETFWASSRLSSTSFFGIMTRISGIVIETGVLESLAHVDHVGRIGDDGEYLTIVGHVFGTGFGGLLEQVVEVNAFGRNNGSVPCVRS